MMTRGEAVERLGIMMKTGVKSMEMIAMMKRGEAVYQPRRHMMTRGEAKEGAFQSKLERQSTITRLNCQMTLVHSSLNNPIPRHLVLC
jgi:hypothetical protein